MGGKREREGPPGYYGFPQDLGVLEYSHLAESEIEYDFISSTVSDQFVGVGTW